MVPDLLEELLKDRSKLFACSKEFAKERADAQGGYAGHNYYMVVATGTCGPTPVVALFDLEIQAGLRGAMDQQGNVEVNRISDLLLGERQKLARVSMFEVKA